jgi:ABC-type transport system involved in multi-copper enzyme maturation permease subunit
VSESGLIFGLPLLTKDLIEQSARRRTYVLRVVYAVVLYGAALWVYGDMAGSGAQSGIANLGRGREMFAMLVKVQMAAIVILLPAICCGAITSEKERDTLGLLLLTKLSPLTIVLEKLLSRLVTMGTYQLLSLPLFAVVYGLGGVELGEIIAMIWFLMMCSTVVAAMSIFWSAWHRTTAGAFISAYACMPLAACMAPIFYGAITQRKAGQIYGAIPTITFVVGLSCASVPMLALTWSMVMAAQAQLLARAFVPPRNVMLELFKRLDTFFEELNQATTSGVLLVRERDTGPLFDPIAWRETRKRSLGTVRYLFRFLVVLEVPLVIVISWTVADAQRHSFDGPTAFFLSMLWPIAALAVAVHTTNVLASERSRQTLDVLLVTPLTSRELVTQKLAGVRRLIGVLTVPFATLLIFQGVWTLYVVRGLNLFQTNSPERTVFLHEVLGMTFAMLVYPRVIQWIAFHLALRLKNQTQAVLSALAVVITICVAPYLVMNLVAMAVAMAKERVPNEPVIEWITWFSPARVLFHRQAVGMAQKAVPNWWTGTLYWDGVVADSAFIGLGMHALFYIGLWFFLRSLALRGFSDWVGRTEPAGAAA